MNITRDEENNAIDFGKVIFLVEVVASLDRLRTTLRDIHRRCVDARKKRKQFRGVR